MIHTTCAYEHGLYVTCALKEVNFSTQICVSYHWQLQVYPIIHFTCVVITSQ